MWLQQDPLQKTLKEERKRMNRPVICGSTWRWGWKKMHWFWICLSSWYQMINCKKFIKCSGPDWKPICYKEDHLDHIPISSFPSSTLFSSAADGGRKKQNNSYNTWPPPKNKIKQNPLPPVNHNRSSKGEERCPSNQLMRLRL